MKKIKKTVLLFILFVTLSGIALQSSAEDFSQNATEENISGNFSPDLPNPTGNSVPEILPDGTNRLVQFSSGEGNNSGVSGVAANRSNGTSNRASQDFVPSFSFTETASVPRATVLSVTNYDHYVSFHMRANSLAPNYAYDLVNRGALSDGSQWVYNMYMHGTDSSGLNGRILVMGYNNGWVTLSPLSTPLSPGTDYSIVWRYSSITGGELFVNNVSQGTSPSGAGTNTLLSTAFHIGEQMYNGGGRQHSAFSGTMWDVYHYEKDLDMTPFANFTGSPTSGTAPLTVQFNDTSTGSPTIWLWDFGDGRSSTAQNASHTYASAGTYAVNLTVANAAGNDMATKEGYVTVTSGTVNYYVFSVTWRVPWIMACIMD